MGDITFTRAKNLLQGLITELDILEKATEETDYNSKEGIVLILLSKMNITKDFANVILEKIINELDPEEVAELVMSNTLLEVAKLSYKDFNSVEVEKVIDLAGQEGSKTSTNQLIAILDKRGFSMLVPEREEDRAIRYFDKEIESIIRDEDHDKASKTVERFMNAKLIGTFEDMLSTNIKERQEEIYESILNDPNYDCLLMNKVFILKAGMKTCLLHMDLNNPKLSAEVIGKNEEEFKKLKMIYKLAKKIKKEETHGKTSKEHGHTSHC